MRCSYCLQEALFKCECEMPYTCKAHLEDHLTTIGIHDYEELVIDLGQSRLHDLRFDIFQRIQKINKAEKLMTLTTESLIKVIQKAHKKAIKRLDSLKSNYLELIEHTKFCDSMLPIIEKIETMELLVGTIKIDEIKNNIEDAFGVDLVKYIEKNRYRKIRFLNEHVGGLRCGAVTKDNLTLVTGGSDCAIRVWDLSNKNQKFVLLGHNSEVQCLTLTGDSKFIISGSFDASVRVWGFHEKRQIVIFKGHKKRIYAVCYIEKTSLIVSGDFAGEIIFWDLINRNIHKKLNLSGGIRSLTLSKNQLNLIVGSNPEIVLYELETGKILNTIKGHRGGVWTTALTSDETKLVTGSWDKSIIIWDWVTFKLISQLYGHQGAINSLVLILNDKFIVSGSFDQTVIIWRMQTGTEESRFSHYLFVNCILQYKKMFLSLSEDSAIGYLDVTSANFYVEWFLKPCKSDSASFKNKLGLVGYGSNEETIIWDMKRETIKNNLFGHEGMVLFVDISNDGQFALSCCQGSTKNLIYWNLLRNDMEAELEGHLDNVFCACFSNDGLMAASGSGDKTVRTWNLREARQDCEFIGHTGFPLSIKFLDNKKLLVSAGNDKKVIIWNLINKTQYALLNGHKNNICKILVTDDEKLIVSGDLYDGIRIWNVNEKKQNFIFSYQEEGEAWLKENRIELDSVRIFLKA